MNTNLAPYFPAPRGLPLRRGYQFGGAVKKPEDEEPKPVIMPSQQELEARAQAGHDQHQKMLADSAARSAEKSAQARSDAASRGRLTQDQAEFLSSANNAYRAGVPMGGGLGDASYLKPAGEMASAAGLLTPVSKIMPKDAAGAAGAAKAGGILGKVKSAAAAPFNPARLAVEGVMTALGAFGTSTDEFRQQTGIGQGAEPSFLNDLAARGVGTLANYGNAVTFGLADRVGNWLAGNGFNRSNNALAPSQQKPQKQTTNTPAQQPEQTPEAARQAAVQQQMNRTALDPAVEQAWRDQTPRGFTTASTPGVYQSEDANGRPVFTNIGADGKTTRASTDASQIRTNGGGSMAGLSPATERALSAARLQAAREGRVDDALASYAPRGLPGVATGGGGVRDITQSMSLRDLSTWQRLKGTLEDEATRTLKPRGRAQAVLRSDKDRQRQAQLQLEQLLKGQYVQQPPAAAAPAAARQTELQKALAAQQPHGVPGVQQRLTEGDIKAGLMQRMLAGDEGAAAQYQRFFVKSDGGGGAGWKVQWNTNQETGRKEPQVTPPEHLILAGARQDEQGRWVIPDKDGKLMEIKPT